MVFYGGGFYIPIEEQTRFKEAHDYRFMKVEHLLYELREAYKDDSKAAIAQALHLEVRNGHAGDSQRWTCLAGTGTVALLVRALAGVHPEQLPRCGPYHMFSRPIRFAAILTRIICCALADERADGGEPHLAKECIEAGAFPALLRLLCFQGTDEAATIRCEYACASALWYLTQSVPNALQDLADTPDVMKVIEGCARVHDEETLEHRLWLALKAIMPPEPTDPAERAEAARVADLREKIATLRVFPEGNMRRLREAADYAAVPFAQLFACLRAALVDDRRAAIAEAIHSKVRAGRAGPGTSWVCLTGTGAIQVLVSGLSALEPQRANPDFRVFGDRPIRYAAKFVIVFCSALADEIVGGGERLMAKEAIAAGAFRYLVKLLGIHGEDADATCECHAACSQALWYLTQSGPNALRDLRDTPGVMDALEPCARTSTEDAPEHRLWAALQSCIPDNNNSAGDSDKMPESGKEEEEEDDKMPESGKEEEEEEEEDKMPKSGKEEEDEDDKTPESGKEDVSMASAAVEEYGENADLWAIYSKEWSQIKIRQAVQDLVKGEVDGFGASTALLTLEPHEFQLLSRAPYVMVALECLAATYESGTDEYRLYERLMSVDGTEGKE